MLEKIQSSNYFYGRLNLNDDCKKKIRALALEFKIKLIYYYHNLRKNILNLCIYLHRIYVFVFINLFFYQHYINHLPLLSENQIRDDELMNLLLN